MDDDNDQMITTTTSQHLKTILPREREKNQNENNKKRAAIIKFILTTYAHSSDMCVDIYVSTTQAHTHIILYTYNDNVC